MTIQMILNESLADTFSKQLDIKEAEVFGIFNHYSLEAVKWMMSVQGSGEKFWTNHTFKAVNSFFAEVIRRKSELVLNFEYDGAALSQGKNPIVYTDILEEGHNKKFAALPSILNKFADLLIADLKVLYGDES